ncbi:MAG: right-handed parallel beta-helix repeat-containing protein [Fibrobacterales bacterium]
MLVVLSLFLCAPLHAIVQQEFFVSPKGLDTNPGTLSAPFATITQARNAMNKIKSNQTGDIIVTLLDGVYHLSSHLAFGNLDGGTNGFEIIYQAQNKGKAIISGGHTVTGWTLHDASKNIYKATVPEGTDTRQLYVNGSRQMRARTADAMGWSVDAWGYNVPNFSEVASWNNLTDIEVVVRVEWIHQRGQIASIDAAYNKVLMKEPYWEGAKASAIFTHSSGGVKDGLPWPAWIENAYEFIDQKGEWYLDKSANTIYLKPYTSVDLATAETIIPTQQTLLTVTDVSHIQFRGLAFKYNTWLQVHSDNGYPHIQAEAYKTKHGSQNMKGAVRITSSSFITIEGCSFEHLGSGALQFSNESNNSLIAHNSFSDISGSGISIANTKEITVFNNYIRRAGREYWGSIGIFAQITEETTIQGNTVVNLPYSGISVGWGWSPEIEAGLNNIIAYNRVDSVMLKFEDGGGIYTLSKQTNASIHHNYITGVRNHRSDARALYPDEGSSNIHIYSNVVRDSDVWAGLWTSTIQNNVLENNYSDTHTTLANGTYNTWRNNTVVTDGNWPQDALSIMSDAGYSEERTSKRPNVALFKSTFASSNWTGKDSRMANDGLLGTNWASDADERSPYLQVDLQRKISIDTIELVSRQGLDQESSRIHLEIQASLNPDFNDFTVLASIDDELLIPHKGTWTVPVAGSDPYQYIRVQRKSDKGHFAFSELRVYEKVTIAEPLSSSSSVSQQNSTSSGASTDDGSIESLSSSSALIHDSSSKTVTSLIFNNQVTSFRNSQIITVDASQQMIAAHTEAKTGTIYSLYGERLYTVEIVNSVIILPVALSKMIVILRYE